MKSTYQENGINDSYKDIPQLKTKTYKIFRFDINIKKEIKKIYQNGP